MNSLQSLFNKQIILCSHSPRRKQILSDLGLNVSTTSVDIIENYPSTLPYNDIAEFLANKKVGAYKKPMQNNEILICADTLVFEQGKVLGKPTNPDDAVRMLKLLSNKEHIVITGCVIKTNKQKISFSEQTKVFFNKLSDEQIDYYIYKYRPFDKAGAYGIQEWIGMVGINKIEGDYYNVMGLPACKLFSYLLTLK